MSYQSIRVGLIFILAISGFSCSQNEELEVSTGTQSAILIPNSTRSCRQELFDKNQSVDGITKDISGKYFEVSRPKLLWRNKDENLEILTMTITADTKNTCGASFKCIYDADQLAYIFGRVNLQRDDLSFRFDRKLYGENTGEFTACKNAGEFPNGSNCNVIEGADDCTLLCGGATAKVENCKVRAKIEVIGIKTNKEGREFPIRASTTFGVENIINID